MSITIGTDPEVMVVDRSGEPVVAIGMIGGSKEEPKPVERGALQEDNVLAEFNIEPVESSDMFIENIDVVLSQLKKQLPKGYHLGKMSSHLFDMDVLKGFGEKAMEFGCDPDYNAWTMCMNQTPEDSVGLRTAGGHIHIGYDDPDDFKSMDIIRACDIYLGIPSVLLDSDSRRRSLYGKAGSFRIKEYGVEYRTLSNFWLHDKELQRWAYDCAVLACTEYEGDIVKNIIRDQGMDGICRIINTSDVDAARYIIDEYGLPMPEVKSGKQKKKKKARLTRSYGAGDALFNDRAVDQDMVIRHREAFARALDRGVPVAAPRPDAMPREWFVEAVDIPNPPEGEV